MKCASHFSDSLWAGLSSCWIRTLVKGRRQIQSLSLNTPPPLPTSSVLRGRVLFPTVSFCREDGYSSKRSRMCVLCCKPTWWHECQWNEPPCHLVCLDNKMRDHRQRHHRSIQGNLELLALGFSHTSKEKPFLLQPLKCVLGSTKLWVWVLPGVLLPSF